MNVETFCGKDVLRTSYFFVIFVAVSLSPISAETKKQSNGVSIVVQPKERPTVNMNVEIDCAGPLQNGGALIRVNGEGENEKVTQVVQFKVETVDSEKNKKEKKKTRKAVLMKPKGGGEIDRFTGLLGTDRHSIKITFRIQYSDAGFYSCQFFDKDGSTVVNKTDEVFMDAYYPSHILNLKMNEYPSNQNKFKVLIVCEAATGVPQGSVFLQVDGVPKLNVSTKFEEMPRKGGAMEYRITLKTILNVSMDLVNRTVTCTVGPKKGKFPGNPRHDNETSKLNLKVPVADTKIFDTRKVLRQPGFQLTCNATGLPKPAISWIISGHKGYVNGSKLMVTKKPGLYLVKCIASNVIFNKLYTQERHFRFAVIPPCPKTSGSSDKGLIVSIIFAVLFGIVAIIFIVLWCNARKQSQYNRM